MIKLSKANITKKNINGKYGPFEAYVIQGETKDDTYNIKEQLKKLGFSYYKGTWWISAKKYNDYIQNELIKLNVQVEPSSSATNTSTISPSQEIKNDQKEKKIHQTWETENPEMSKWYGFPINHNIESFNLEFDIDGEKHIEPITIDRLYVKGKTSGYYNEKKSRKHRGIPLYVFNIGKLSEPKKDYRTNQTIDHLTSIKFISRNKWGEYNEKDFIDELKDIVKKKLEGDKSIKQSLARNVLMWHYDIQKREPELNKLLQNKEIDGFEVRIRNAKNPLYNGTYPAKVELVGVENDRSAYLYTNLNHPLSGNETMLGSLSLYGIHTVDDFYTKIKQDINEDKEKNDYENRYIKFLESFPFLEDEKNEANQSFEIIKNYLEGGTANSDQILHELQKREYIRPHKRQKQQEGLSSGQEIKWVVDSKKIVNEAYQHNKSPNYFYAVLAYYIHRKVRGIWSWTDMMLVDCLSSWYNTMKRFGLESTFEDIEKSIESIGNTIVSKIYGGKTKEQINNEFNEWFDGKETGNIDSSLIEFVNFAKQFNIDVENIQENAKYIYRTLAKKLHPDLYKDEEKPEMEQKFKELQNIWDKVPQQYKVAFNWYKMEKISHKINHEN